ncbi:MAG: protein-L-isoaspartate(D-aspartate) O-methyltransferase [Sedimentisphaerales bacterium]|nr:protein-L-isoaspartate(D-aspartate) O-methyltransferase [Sedimentisphaerales bacterium]
MVDMSKCSDRNNLDRARQRMLAHDLRGRDIVDPDVLEAMAAVPRERFVPNGYYDQAYFDGPLPIGSGQTISQPYIVALMTQELRLSPDCRVLEIGTGSGYQTAVLARLVARIYTIERMQDLSAAAQDVLAEVGVDNAEFRVGDGGDGWPQQAPFDRVIVTAAVPSFPRPLIAQLAEAGRIIAPIGPGAVQQLIVAEKYRGKLIERHVCSCRFVRLISEHGFGQ